MDSYLEIARTVLRSARQPLSARQILKTAHQLQLVPRDLYGRTQQKTLQARIASDILKHRTRSEFYRTGPGRFFLRIFQSDGTIPHKYRREFQAPSRAAQLGRFDVIAFPRTALSQLASKGTSRFSVATLFGLPWRFVRLYGLRGNVEYVPFRFHLLLFSDDGTFVDHQRPTGEGDMAHRGIVGIPGVVKKSDRTLFSSDEFGLAEAAIRTLLEHFELPPNVVPALEDATRWSKAKALVDADDPAASDLIILIGFRCAGISEVLEAVNASITGGWLSLPIRLNDLSRFDKWSSRIITDPDLQAELSS